MKPSAGTLTLTLSSPMAGLPKRIPSSDYHTGISQSSKSTLPHTSLTLSLNESFSTQQSQPRSSNRNIPGLLHGQSESSNQRTPREDSFSPDTWQNHPSLLTASFLMTRPSLSWQNDANFLTGLALPWNSSQDSPPTSPATTSISNDSSDATLRLPEENGETSSGPSRKQRRRTIMTKHSQLLPLFPPLPLPNLNPPAPEPPDGQP